MTYQMYIANKIAAIVTMSLCAIMIIVAIKSIILIRQSDKSHRDYFSPFPYGKKKRLGK